MGLYQDKYNLPAVRARDPFDAKWHIYADRKTYGPFSGHELRGLVAKAQLIQTDLVSADDGAHWVEARTDPILRTLFSGLDTRDAPPSRFTAKNGRRWNAYAGMFLLATLGWLIWPYYSLYSLGIAVRDGDVSSLEGLVDWQSVRQGLRGDLNAMLLKKADGEKDNLGRGLAMVLGPTFVNQMVEGYVTPQNLASLIRTGKPQGASPNDTSVTNQTTASHPQNRFRFPQVKYAFFNGGPMSFRVDVRPDTPGATGMVRLDLKWSGIWKVDRISLPLDEIETFSAKNQRPDAEVAFVAPEQATKSNNQSHPVDNSAMWGYQFKTQVNKCWKKPYGGQEALTTAASFSVKLKLDGSLVEAPKAVGAPAITPFSRQYQDSALRAIVACAPYNLPAAFYDEWRYFEPVFSERQN